MAAARGRAGHRRGGRYRRHAAILLDDANRDDYPSAAPVEWRCRNPSVSDFGNGECTTMARRIGSSGVHGNGRSEVAKGSQFVGYFGPVLDALRQLGDSGSPSEVADTVARNLKLPDAILNELVPSGESRYRNQIQWARYYLSQAGLIGSSRRGVWTLTDKGRRTTLNADQAQEVFADVLKRYMMIRQLAKSQNPIGEVGSRSSSIENKQPSLGTEATVVQQEESLAPKDETEDSSETIGGRVTYRELLLERIRGLRPSGFERLTQRLLRESGFSQVEVTGKSGDGGIDGSGTLSLNKLISIRVLFQCKKYRGSVGSEAVRNFRGAMQGRADYGLILTTGSFTADARREASRDGVSPIELIDGERLIDLMKDLQLGLKPVQTFIIDETFFQNFNE